MKIGLSHSPQMIQLTMAIWKSVMNRKSGMHLHILWLCFACQKTVSHQPI